MRKCGPVQKQANNDANKEILSLRFLLNWLTHFLWKQCWGNQWLEWFPIIWSIVNWNPRKKIVIWYWLWTHSKIVLHADLIVAHAELDTKSGAGWITKHCNHIYQHWTVHLKGEQAILWDHKIYKWKRYVHIESAKDFVLFCFALLSNRVCVSCAVNKFCVVCCCCCLLFVVVIEWSKISLKLFQYIIDISILL